MPPAREVKKALLNEITNALPKRRWNAIRVHERLISVIESQEALLEKESSENFGTNTEKNGESTVATSSSLLAPDSVMNSNIDQNSGSNNMSNENNHVLDNVESVKSIENQTKTESDTQRNQELG